jgi:hypothetical protein
MLNKDLDYTINSAKIWLIKQKNGSAWNFPVINPNYVATALAIYVLTGEKKSIAVQYLLKKKVWEKCLIAAEIFGIALQETGEKDLAEEVFCNCRREIKKMESGKRISFNRRLKNIKLMYPFNLSEEEISLLPIYTTLFKILPEKIWYSRTSPFYQVFHQTAILLISKKNARINKKIVNVLRKALNDDGSYGGLTIWTIEAVYILIKLNEDKLASKSLEWIEKTISENGSLRPMLWQDVYDTAWCSLALANCGENISENIGWLDKTRVGEGYPYISGSFFPDPDDTPLVLLAKIVSNNFDMNDYKSLEFLINCQKSNGGWTWSPFLEGTVKKTFFRIISIFFKVLEFTVCKYRKGYGFLSWFYSHQSFQPSIDITSRVLITLSYFKEREDIEKSIKKGAIFLLSNYSDGRFHANRLYTSSPIYETSMALIALYKNGIKNGATEQAFKWLMDQKIESAEDAAHVLWVLMERDNDKVYADNLVDFIISKQLPDGSWEFKVGFLAYGQFYYSLFSIAAPLYALTLYRNKYRV